MPYMMGVLKVLKVLKLFKTLIMNPYLKALYAVRNGKN